MNQSLQWLVDEIFRLNDEFNRMLDVKLEQALNAPATQADIELLQRHVGIKLPPSYCDLLTICNGWMGFSANLHLLSVQQQLSGEYARYIHQWKGEQWAYGEPVPVEGIIFGIELNTNNARLFDINTADETGEMEAVWWDNGELHRYINLIEMLEQYHRRLKYLINRKRRQLRKRN